MDSEKLLACPFCGGEAFPGTIRYGSEAAKEIGDGKQLIYHMVNCAPCGASVGSQIGYATAEQAAARWNTRPTTENGLREALGRVAAKVETAKRIGTVFVSGVTPDDLDILLSALQHNSGERDGHSELAERVRGILSVIRTSVELDPDTDWDGSAVKILIEAVEALSQAPR